MVHSAQAYVSLAAPYPVTALSSDTRATAYAADGTVRFSLMSKHADPAVGWTDPSVDIGAFTAAILTKPQTLTSGKTYPVMHLVKTDDLVRKLEQLSGAKVAWEPLSKDELHDMMAGKPFGEMLEVAMSEMFQCVSRSHLLDAAQPGTDTRPRSPQVRRLYARGPHVLRHVLARGGPEPRAGRPGDHVRRVGRALGVEAVSGACLSVAIQGCTGLAKGNKGHLCVSSWAT